MIFSICLCSIFRCTPSYLFPNPLILSVTSYLNSFYFFFFLLSLFLLMAHSETSVRPDVSSPLVCKICLEKDDGQCRLISPCKCKGSIKYVHVECMASWRSALFHSGRDNDLYHCTLCKHRFSVRPRRPWMAVLNYRVMRILVTVLLLVFILIPAGTIMKAFIHISLLLSNYPGGLTSNSFSDLMLSLKATVFPTIIGHHMPSPQEEIFPSSQNTTFRVLFSPFPVCFPSSSSSSASSSSPHSHSLFHSSLLYYLLLPFSDDRVWRLILCKLEHFHLGFFLLGSVNNIWFTYKILNDMFDIVISGQDRAPAVGDEGGEENGPGPRMEGIARRLSRLLKGFLLTYCCSLVVLFWIHFNLFAFHVDTRYEAFNANGEYDSKQFVAELPLWTLRWVTLGVAVGDFAARGIYRWIGRITNCVDEEEVLSLSDSE
ncbi:uncharacterized protein BYT42DRAFT_99303 [Radiomyces spectabilis]|uniref:uncharacterized protein n=1 Tax=Radiomyces spectabilis TaxID=64574 RepID=UPI00221E7524|nr:uncharacterized protein BYT42DRAFT_99303 [Radiomyces spectabilis]KAI8370697.1 hypothetical protein BYT42DRAFT_99303 [Radiomyces spectabilis]